MKRKGSAMGASKYEFEPGEFEKDIEDKEHVAKLFKNDLRETFNQDIRYRNNIPMSKRYRLQLAREVYEELYREVEE